MGYNLWMPTITMDWPTKLSWIIFLSNKKL